MSRQSPKRRSAQSRLRSCTSGCSSQPVRRSERFAPRASAFSRPASPTRWRSMTGLPAVGSLTCGRRQAGRSAPQAHGRPRDRGYGNRPRCRPAHPQRQGFQSSSRTWLTFAPPRSRLQEAWAGTLWLRSAPSALYREASERAVGTLRDREAVMRAVFAANRS